MVSERIRITAYFFSKFFSLATILYVEQVAGNQSAHAQGLSLIEFYQPTISLRVPKVLAVTANKATIAVYRSRIAKSYARKG